MSEVWYFEDVPVGMKTKSKYGRTIRECDLVNFAGISGEYDPLSMDAEYAKTTKYGAVVAQDMLLYAFTPSIEPVNELVAKMNQSILAAKGVHNWKIYGKAKVGDTVYLTNEVVEKIDNRPNRGTVIMRNSIINQNGEVLQAGDNHVVVAKKCFFQKK